MSSKHAANADHKWVYFFGDGTAEGAADMRDLLGGKGANLAEMSNIGLPVPPGFTVTTEVCTAFYANNRSYPDGFEVQLAAALDQVGAITGRVFGDPERPLLLSVRSGARVSMPGMMDTVLNLGLNDATAQALVKETGDARFVYDSYRRFIQMYSAVVLDVAHHLFEDALDDHKLGLGITQDTDMKAEDWRDIVATYKQIVRDELGEAFPEDAKQQLWGGIGAVFGSWQSARAQTYRRIHNIADDWGTAVNVQAMVFGNMGNDSATGVAFTRNPATGEKSFYGEFLVNAQGEDVVAGIRTPQHLTRAAREQAGESDLSLEERMPEAFAELTEAYRRLEAHYRDMQDIEFTIERGKLWMLQTRSGKRTTQAALKIAVDMVAEGLIDQAEAVGRIDPASLDQLLHPSLDPDAPREVLTRGLPASPGAGTGEVALTPEKAEEMAAAGKSVILVRTETSPEDIHGMHVSAGILTSRGGMTSHAAVVARGMGKPCVSGAGAIRVNAAEGGFEVAGCKIAEGDVITIDGSTGEVILGAVPMIQPELSGDFAALMGWADEIRRLKVRANAETPEDARTARQFGAEGIGLCRTEHMFFEGNRVVAMREMILAEDEAGRRAALAKILPMQRDDFVQLFTIMAGLPVTVRLLDPPLHEFLPHKDSEFAEVAAAIGRDVAELRARASDLAEANPMLGHRGARLGISYPEIYEMQARAIFEAALTAGAQTGAPVTPEIMVPLIATRKELEILKARIDAVAAEVGKEKSASLSYHVGTMIELPRAALRAGDIAEHAEFFSFGTNDLTQTTYGISRDDSASFLNDYLRAGIFTQDPFVSLDQEGVGELVALAAERGRATRADIKLGICGEHGGDPDSVRFCNAIGLDYVSCSPYRVPIARLAAAQAAMAARERDV